jgi:hypothetical protein
MLPFQTHTHTHAHPHLEKGVKKGCEKLKNAKQDLRRLF